MGWGNFRGDILLTPSNEGRGDKRHYQTLRDETRDPDELGGSAVLRYHFDALRRGRSTKSAASSASLRSVLRGVPICARMVRPRARSVTWLARAATGKSDGISPALIPSRKRRSTSATPPATASCRNCRTSASSTSGATHTRRQPGADPFSVALSTACLRKPASESRRVCGERSAFAARAPFRLCVRPKDAQEYRPLVPEDGIQARPSHAHPGDEIVDRHSVVAFRPEHLSRLFQRVPSRRSCAVVPAA